MGGGGAMRAAAKVAGIGVVNGGRRGFLAENPVATAAARTATRPASAAISTSDETRSGGFAVVSQNDVIDAGVQRPCWELDDWEFAGAEEEMIVQPREPMPRLVFGCAPTLQEAKDATSELKDALEKVYLSSPNSTGCGDSYMSDNESTLSLLSETKACVTSETTVASVPKNALQAFRLLHESSTAQNVVASIASDPNVWHALLKNEALVEYLQSQKSSKICSVITSSFYFDFVTSKGHKFLLAVAPSDLDPVMKESAAKTAFLDHLSQENVAGSYDSEQSAGSGNGVRDFLQSIKATVVDMVTSLSDYFQSIFGGPSADTDGSAGATFVDKAVGASFMGLVVMVIMVVVLKRG
ncbi:uncharacterized conserved protein [Actinidia rufa]|uniref:Uncharacterized conserved protein n=1 Tax=Actinidia rufa TaxID=165716 RepID=A0A7J0G9K5_9ERIC|nr:uncharacterized conserved protein [Actinidia rufa]